MPDLPNASMSCNVQTCHAQQATSPAKRRRRRKLQVRYCTLAVLHQLPAVVFSVPQQSADDCARLVPRAKHAKHASTAAAGATNQVLIGTPCSVRQQMPVVPMTITVSQQEATLSGSNHASVCSPAGAQQQQQQQQEQDDGDISLFSGAAATQQQQQQVVAAEPPLPQVHSNDPHEEANVIRKALRIKVGSSLCTFAVSDIIDLRKQEMIPTCCLVGV
jgi:hypothetical protein